MNQEKIDKAQRALRLAAKMSKRFYEKKLIICYSGGKDSDVLVHLAEHCLDKDDFMVQNSHTSVDAPETVYHIREVIKGLNGRGIEAKVEIPRYKDGTPKTMWNLIPKNKVPPTRTRRYCCDHLKEQATPHSIIVVGVRASESKKRQGRDIFSTWGSTKAGALYFSLEHAEEVYEESIDRDPVWDCKLIENARKKRNEIVNPIYEWTDDDVWEYAKANNIKMNPLYECGFKRVGCIGCPLAGPKNMRMAFERYPSYKANYIKAFDRMLKHRRELGMETQQWTDAESVMTWWLGGDPNQITIDQWLKEKQ